MTKDDQIKELENKLDNIKKEIDSLKSKKGSQVGDTYYYIGSQNYIDNTTYEDDDFDRGEQKIGNIFQTEEEAKKELDKRVLLQEMKEFAGYRPVWDNETRNYRICYDLINKRFTVVNFRHIIDLTAIYFSTEVRAEDAVCHFGDRLELLI